MPSLQICIPTYNREDALVENIRRLKSFQHELDFKILIVDNATDDFSSSSLLDDLVAEGTAVVKNPTNIGGQANVLRCFEASNSEYVWIVGDDDFLDANGIAAVLNELSLDGETDVFNFRCEAPHHLKARSQYRGELRSEFIRSIGNLGALYYVVGYVFKRSSVLPYLKNAYLNLNYFCPHVALFMNAHNLQYKSSNTCVHVWQEVSSKDNSLSPVPLLMNVPLILQNTSSFSELRILKRYVREAKKHFISPLKLPLAIIQTGVVLERSTAAWMLRKYWMNNERQVPTFSGLLCVLYLFVYWLSPVLTSSLSTRVLGLFQKSVAIPKYVMSDKRI